MNTIERKKLKSSGGIVINGPASAIQERIVTDLSKQFIREFSDITGLTGLAQCFDEEYLSYLQRLTKYLQTKSILPFPERKRRFIAHVNWKLRLNSQPLSRFYGVAACQGIIFHYHHKTAIQRAFDLRDKGMFEGVLREKKVSLVILNILLEQFNPVAFSVTTTHLRSECNAPTKLRREIGSRDIRAEIIKAHFSAFMWCTLPEQKLHGFFDPHFSESEYQESFWGQLHTRATHLFSRGHSLHILRLNQHSISTARTSSDVRNMVCQLVRDAYTLINNYGFFAVLLEPIEIEGRSILWEVAGDITLYAEKHIELSLNKGYFRWEDVQLETAKYIKGLNTSSAKFNLANEGFSYRDCFVIATGGVAIRRLLLIFQKNQRDETLIPCPRCRSTNVQGNSYSSLGVRSWECNNILCPDRSKYNRGKRYSFRGLAMQQAIDDERNEIPTESIRRWVRDVVHNAADSDVLEMLLRHYSIYGDTVHLYNWPSKNTKYLGRELVCHKIGAFARDESLDAFWGGCFFSRYVKNVPIGDVTHRANLGTPDFQVIHGDSAQVLAGFQTGYFDVAVTSPPYYNAREYSQWANIYCYLYDMFNVNRQVFRTLKSGGLYFYNIFDYFDNEKTVVFSAMGQKRMILSAYTLDLFRRIGFECLGNVVWDKGDIEGKRGFNAGNFSPYYQAPFNCWEHVLVFRKPCHTRLSMKSHTLNRVLRQHPVTKIVRGDNVHGHSAPFPDAIAELALNFVKKGDYVLDPFAGSLTTGRVAYRRGVRSVCIERLKEYCLLGLRMKVDEDAVVRNPCFQRNSLDQ